ncbi:uncharacterized protein LOC129915985 [Episyrphus balteatus]|uniref:uncharacterized protein LOC129915985 n=1 Tax=Episyrphus balteatus TaxID=286459 RepID=UPI0024863B8A|nr:uncharacterized protein LOC129915985 [Episyrphus balteatus]XP_055851722.1 uncharacterized protein LOC129915985 [Episyrphus balteatus]XP_055851729.1 uncharacterized protein LOC129915985 [Episyrphus balteatus]
MSGSKTDALPKRGHVNEVCKEWLVREDGALAYKLQSQEINDFYQGNRYRNEVVRTDFPQALEEQIKEKENAEKQKECYKKYLSEQEEHDKRVAMEISEKLEKDILEQQQRELEESEEMADKLQSIYVNLPPPVTLDFSISSLNENPIISPVSSRDLSKVHHSQEVGIPLTLNSPNIHPEDFHLSVDHQQRNHRSKFDHDYIHDMPDASMNTHMSRVKHNSKHSLPVDSITPYTEVSEPTNSFIPDLIKKKTPHSHLSKQKRSDIAGDTKTRSDFNFQNNNCDQFLESNSRSRNQHSQLLANDIELYVDPNLQELGLPMEEIKEINKKIKQERKDEELARKLQEMEKLNGMTLEDRDRLLAIEAQDKELAKMLQEREKAKAKRAKEKARLRKHQNQKEISLHTGPLLPLPQESQVSTLCSKPEEIDSIDLEAYSNPKDLISHQRIQNECFGGNSINSTAETIDNIKDDDIYTLPIDSCSSADTVLHIQTSVSGQSHALIRQDKYSPPEMQNDFQNSVQKNYSMSSSYEQQPGPAPPYMPIQGTRRSNSNDERKKRSKDKCTHQ